MSKRLLDVLKFSNLWLARGYYVGVFQGYKRVVGSWGSRGSLESQALRLDFIDLNSDV
jgi:hypothetical protein